MTAICSGALRDALDSDGGASSRCSDRACSPWRPSTTPNSTFCPALSVVTPGGSAFERT